MISSRFYNFNFSTFATLFVISITNPFDYCERDTKIEHLILSANFLPLFFCFFYRETVLIFLMPCFNSIFFDGPGFSAHIYIADYIEKIKIQKSFYNQTGLRRGNLFHGNMGVSVYDRFHLKGQFLSFPFNVNIQCIGSIPVNILIEIEQV